MDPDQIAKALSGGGAGASVEEMQMREAQVRNLNDIDDNI